MERVTSILKKVAMATSLLAVVHSAQAQYNQPESYDFTADYINSVYYYKNLDHLRGAYDRVLGMQSLTGKYTGRSDSLDLQGTSVIYDFNYGRNIVGDSKIPMLFGGAYVSKNYSVHALISTTHMRIFSHEDTWQEKLQADPKRFQGTTIGGSYNHKWFNVLGDITYAQKNLSYFGQLNVPIIKLRAGIGLSPYTELTDTLGFTKIVEGNKITPDYYFVKSAIIPFINFGFSVLSFSEVRVSPNVSFSLYQIRKKEKWHNLKFDMEVFIQTHSPGYKEILEFEDVDARVTFYLLGGKSEERSRGIVNPTIATHQTLFLGLSYKSGKDYITETMRNAGVFYAGPKGLGGELGVGVRVLGLKNYNVDNETFLKLSLYYNYSEYYEVWPSLIGGIKFRVLL